MLEKLWNIRTPGQTHFCLRGSTYFNRWLYAPPLKFLKQEVISVTAQISLGNSIACGFKNFYCRACKQKGLDEYGDHALSCKYTGDVIGRHDAVRDALDEIAKEAGFQCFKEVGVMRDRMGDAVIRNFNMGRGLFVDVSVTHTLYPSYADHLFVCRTASCRTKEEEI